MGKYVRKSEDEKGIHTMGKIEKKVLEAWKRGAKMEAEGSDG